MAKDKTSRHELKRNRELKGNLELAQGSIPRDSKSFSRYDPDEFIAKGKPNIPKDIPEKERKRLEKLAEETEKNKKALVSQLRKTPIAQIACEKTGIGRSTYYKWRANDFIFARVADKAMDAGRFFINDMAESKLVKLIQDSNMQAISLWLRHNHPRYTSLGRIIKDFEILTETLSTEEKNVAEQMLSELVMNKAKLNYSSKDLKEYYDKEESKSPEDEKRMREFEED